MTFDLTSATPVPGYEHELQSGQRQPFPSDEFVRIFWTLQGPLEESVSVMQDKYSPDPPLEAYYERTLDGDSWHPISDKPVTKPPVSNLFADVCQLEDWGEEWAEFHADCLGRVFQDSEGNETEDRQDEDGNWDRLIRCCGQNRPPESVKLEVRASKRPFVTIHDYLTAVHPWLMGQREALLTAMNSAEELSEPLPADTKLAVNVNAPEDLIIDDVESWKAFTRRRTGAIVRNIPVSGQVFTTVE